MAELEPARRGSSCQALVVFDLDGTLLRGRTVCEVLADSLGRLERMRELERFSTRNQLRAAREEMATWYHRAGIERLREELRHARLAPGASEGLARLARHGAAVGIASITWDFAVEHFARRLGVDHWQGTELVESGAIRHVWPEDKAAWVRSLARALGVPRERTAAVGDSPGDTAMLDAVGVPIFVGRELPASQPGWLHHPAGDIAAIGQDLVDRWELAPLTVSIERLGDLSDGGFDALQADSERAGLRFLRRLADEWASGVNRFDRPGEALFAARVGRHLVAVGGLNRDPYTTAPRVGRVRHVYVHSAYRRQGIGRGLVTEILAAAHGRFEILRLSTSNPAAAGLYERLGFHPSSEDAHCTHVLASVARE